MAAPRIREDEVVQLRDLIMDNISGSEWLILMVMIVHLLFVPGTKVEESFNVQASHDLIYETTSLANFDHHQFPGVVPRTFAGPVVLATFAFPLRFLFFLFAVPKIWMLFVVRFVLGIANVIAFLNFARCVQKHFGDETAFFLRLITASQFHFLFYASRTLPNIFALFFVLHVLQKIMDERYQSAVRWATVAVLLFRCELVLLFGPLFLPLILMGRLPLLSSNGALIAGIETAVKALAITIPLDSFMWGRWVWPEAEVAYFNIVLNKSHEYGVMPFFWYFYSAIPRATLFSLILVPLGLLLDRRLRSFLASALIFVFLYSFLPHKELRFIIYVFPILNLAAAVFCARMWINRSKNFVRLFLACAASAHLLLNFVTAVFVLYASAKNYPGFDAITYLQYMQRVDAHKPLTLHMDVMTCQTGVSRFVHLFPDWQYNKTENLPLEELKKFDFLAVGAPESKLRALVKANYSDSHRLLYSVSSFSGIKWRKSSLPPLAGIHLYYPEILTKEQIAVLRLRDDFT